MRLKPKGTTQNTRALHYKRFIGIEKSSSFQTLYNTTEDGLFWSFDNESLSFSQVNQSDVSASSKVVSVPYGTFLQYLDNYFKYNATISSWSKVEDISQATTLLSASFNNIAKYQTNRYYYTGSFDFMIRGSIGETTTQIIKGNIAPLVSLNIKYYDDFANLKPDDLVVIEGRLYSVEDVEVDHKHQPRDYSVYFATLNSIL